MLGFYFLVPGQRPKKRVQREFETDDSHLFPFTERREEDVTRVSRDCDELLSIEEEPAERGRGPETVETKLRAGAGRAVGHSQAKHHRGGQLLEGGIFLYFF